MTAVETRLRGLFDELVPSEGRADTVAGEIVRAVNRIAWRNYNDGDHIGVGYGNETCNPAARYLRAKCGEEVKGVINKMWGDALDGQYDASLEKLEVLVLGHLDEHPELREAINTEDMWDYRDPREDVDDSCGEEDEWGW